MFRSKSAAVKPLAESEERKIPGKDGMKFYHLVNLIRNGHGYFKKKQDHYRSTVFRVNIGVKGIAVCDRKGIEALFDVDKVYKQPRFGRLNYNLCLLDGYTPSIFVNDVQHAKQKTFLMNVCQLAQKADVLETTNKIVPEYLERWHSADSKVKADWEKDVMSMTSAIFSEAFLGVRVESSDMHDMVMSSWTKNKSMLRRGMSGANNLRDAFRKAPKLNSILELGKEMELTEEQSIMDVLFMLNFNGYGGVSGALRASIGRLHNLEPEAKRELEQEILENLGSDGITHEALKKMKLMDRFVLEVFRLSPPVPIVFGRARKDFVLHSNTSSVLVKADELLIGNSYLAQRDSTVFQDPDEFRPSRFEDERLLNHILFSNGPYREEATPDNHHCPGKEIIFSILKITLIYFILCCDFTFTKSPYWTPKKLRRLGCPDNRMEINTFNYTPNSRLTKEGNLEVEDVENE